MRNTMVVLAMLTFFIGVVGASHGALVDGVYWADEVTDWTGDVQNYGGELMTKDTAWWLTGPPDADVDGNDYGWDDVDNDYVGGWRASGGASITVYFEVSIWDVNGPDFLIHEYAGPNASASVWASSDNLEYVQVGELGGGTPGYFTDDWIDLDGLVRNAHYIRVIREASGPQTGTFIDALGAPWSALIPEPVTGIAGKGAIPGVIPLPEPGSVTLLGLGCLAIARRRR